MQFASTNYIQNQHSIVRYCKYPMHQTPTPQVSGNKTQISLHKHYFSLQHFNTISYSQSHFPSINLYEGVISHTLWTLFYCNHYCCFHCCCKHIPGNMGRKVPDSSAFHQPTCVFCIYILEARTNFHRVMQMHFAAPSIFLHFMITLNNYVWAFG